MTSAHLPDALAGLESAEEFLQHFGIDYDPAVLAVHRLHILQRFHNYLAAAAPDAGAGTWQALLRRAYEDFVRSDARTEAVFRVFQRAQGVARVPLSRLVRSRP
ncbi:MAG: nitrogenase-stabilizing/protective protein NifW [Candidatus Dactylopiibacterium sp.]|nr:nitrogenase-stabilizing/protective protein NifW [Candidatus Dactylopiibacterium sp.]